MEKKQKKLKKQKEELELLEKKQEERFTPPTEKPVTKPIQEKKHPSMWDGEYTVKTNPIVERAFDSIRDENTGKVKGVTPQGLKKVMIAAASVFFLSMLAIKINKSVEDQAIAKQQYLKEMEPSCNTSSPNFEMCMRGIESTRKNLPKDYTIEAVFAEGNSVEYKLIKRK